jgi:glutathione S-transferase
MLRLYDSLLSGNSWKVRILLSQLHLRYERVTLDLVRGDTHRPDFRKISRFSRIPALMIDDGRTIVESGAILTYLADGTDLLPADSYLRAEVFSWLFFEQADLQKAIAVSRVYHLRGQAARGPMLPEPNINRYERVIAPFRAPLVRRTCSRMQDRILSGSSPRLCPQERD